MQGGAQVRQEVKVIITGVIQAEVQLMSHIHILCRSCIGKGKW